MPGATERELVDLCVGLLRRIIYRHFVDWRLRHTDDIIDATWPLCTSELTRCATKHRDNGQPRQSAGGTTTTSTAQSYKKDAGRETPTGRIAVRSSCSWRSLLEGRLRTHPPVVPNSTPWTRKPSQLSSPGHTRPLNPCGSLPSKASTTRTPPHFWQHAKRESAESLKKTGCLWSLNNYKTTPADGGRQENRFSRTSNSSRQPSFGTERTTEDTPESNLNSGENGSSAVSL